jgi:hypothetical protein
MERKHITRVDTFLDSLNKTVLSELRTMRTQYDQIWQSTVIALETQREQSQREIVALTSRLNVLADEVVFQKRMAILQSVLLLACLVLVIFSRGGLAALDNASFPSTGIPHSAAATPYRRWRGGPESLSDLSASSPPLTTATATTLAASALPRHLYSTPASSLSNIDKTLPLTPSPSNYSRESTPARHLANRNDDDNNSPETTSFYDDATTVSGGAPPLQERRGASSDAEISSIETNPNSNPNHSSSPDEDEAPPTPPTPTIKEGSFGDDDQDRREREKPPLARARSTMAQQPGGLRKTLPALPEDPS